MIREKLGFSKPRISGFDRRGGDLSAYWRSVTVVDGGRGGQVGYSAQNALLFGAKREGSTWMRGTAELSIG